MRIIPAIDIIEGKCVRLTKGNYRTKIIYNESPLEVAKKFEECGMRFLHLVDLDGAKAKRVVNYKILEEIASKTSLRIDYGGGLRTQKDMEIAFNSGAYQVTGGSIAVTDRILFLSLLAQYGSERIILGADCRDRKIATDGWITGSETDVLDFIKDYEQQGIQYVITTDILKDGMLEGASNLLYSEILKNTHVKMIASGGVASIKDLADLKTIGCEGVIIGKALYEGKIDLKGLKELC